MTDRRYRDEHSDYYGENWPAVEDARRAWRWGEVRWAAKFCLGAGLVVGLWAVLFGIEWPW